MQGQREVFIELGNGTFATKVIAGNHQFIVDEPIEVGGSDSGADPYEYIMGALGSCTAITISMYAKRKGWLVEKILVKLVHYNSHFDDCVRCKDDDAKLETMEREITISGNLDPEQLSRLELISTKCPVHKTLEQGINIKTTLRQS